jgi:hypothetical protein
LTTNSRRHPARDADSSGVAPTWRAVVGGGLSMVWSFPQLRMRRWVSRSLTISAWIAGAIDSGTMLDLSTLNNFVYNAPAERRGRVTAASRFKLAAAAIIQRPLQYERSSTSSGTGNLTLGAGPISSMPTRSTSAPTRAITVAFPGASAVRLRGASGLDGDRVNMLLGNHNTSGSGSSSTATLSFNGHPVDLQIGNLTLGRSSSNPTANSPGNGTISFDSGTMDVTNVTMGLSAGTSAFATANGTLNVGTNGTLLVGSGGISLANGPQPRRRHRNLNVSGTVIARELSARRPRPGRAP